MILKAEHLSKRFANFQALHDVSLSLEQGEVVGFLGPNGAGKSTTMKILTGYLSAGGGAATINGHDLMNDPLACRKSIGYLPEEVPLYLDMTVTAYLDHVARLKGVDKAARRREVVEAIERAWLAENAERMIRKLSKGNRQRVGLAQALIGKPPLLIFDEPTSGLDPAQVANFRDLIKALSRQHTILLSTHILSEVEATCGRVVMVNRGRTILCETIDELKRRAHHVAKVRIRLRDGDVAQLAKTLAERSWAGNVHEQDDSLVLDAASDHRAELVMLAEQHGGLRELSEERRSLEEVFRELTATAPQ
jgi:ABC-2 type transport system ATP-binding protein